MIDILVYEDGIVTDAGVIERDERTDIWRITRQDKSETVRVGKEFTKYTVDSLPEDYEDFKYYYRGFFELNVLYYHNETEQRFSELNKINEDLNKQLELQAQAIMELAEIIGGAE